MNPKMVGRAPHPDRLPIGSADSTDAEREKHSHRRDVEMRQEVQGFNARTLARGILTPSPSPIRLERVASGPPTSLLEPEENIPRGR
jgi:hypothetical protein